MEEKLKRLIDVMEYHELLKLQDDVAIGSPIVKNMIQEKWY